MKRFVLDTNVLLHDSSALHAFGNDEVILTLEVLEELDKFKKDNSELGRNSRQVIRELDKLRKLGNLSEGVPLNGGRLRILTMFGQTADALPLANDTPDNRILNKIYRLQKEEPGVETIFVSKDINLRVKADAFGINAQDFEGKKVDFDEIYKGMREVMVSDESLDSFFQNDQLRLELDPPLFANEFVVLRAGENGSKSALGIYDKKIGSIVPLNSRSSYWSIKPKNKEQVMALHLLMDDRIKIITLMGTAGTGKTLLALAAGLVKVIDEEAYSRMLISRPVMPLGRDLGYLPGSKEEKLTNWMGPIYDNLEFILSTKQNQKKKEFAKVDVERFIEEGVIEMEALTYMRGRSIPSQYILIDEAQNLSPHEIKTIISRVGDKSKIVLTGDPYQIDSPYLDASSNGLSYCVEHLKGQQIFGHIFLAKSERSEVASIAADYL